MGINFNGSDGFMRITGGGGAQGAQGPQGYQGTSGGGGGGAQGAQGSQGTAGSQGTQGTAGSQGNQGVPGIGAQGPQGTAGAQGTQGTAGSQGNQGVPGIGAQGPQGTAGAQGSAGAQGTAGSQGNQGVQGSTGSAGGAGSQGSTGSVSAQYIDILNSSVNTSTTGVTPLVVGATAVNPSILTQFTTATFEGILSLATASGSLTATMQLYNVTTASVVATLTTLLGTETFLTSSSFSIPASTTMYEVRIYVSDASSSSYKAIANMARIKFA